MGKAEAVSRFKSGKKTFAPGVRAFIIISPLVIVTAFCFSYMHYQSMAMRKALDAKKTAASSSTADGHQLPIIAQPLLMRLSTDTPPAAAGGTDMSALTNTNNLPASVGPAPAGTDQALQGAVKDTANDTNGALQATRQKVELDNLNL